MNSSSNPFARSILLLGEEKIQYLNKTHIAIVGLGGVGSYTVEALTRAGVGKLTIIDYAKITGSNLNRQLYALNSTIGENKVDVAKMRINDINPKCTIFGIIEKISNENIFSLGLQECDALIDCIDDINAKVQLLKFALESKIPVITSVMGASTRMDGSKVQACDILNTTHCPLSKKLRKLLKNEGIETGITAIYSTEKPANKNMRMSLMGSFSCLPGIFGLRAAQETLTKLLTLKYAETIVKEY